MAPPPPIQLTVFHEALVLHSHIEVAYPPATVLVLATDDTRAHMDRLDQRFRHMKIFDGVTDWDDIDVCAPKEQNVGFINRYIIEISYIRRY